MERCGFGTKAGEAVAVGFGVLVWGSNVRHVRFDVLDGHRQRRTKKRRETSRVDSFHDTSRGSPTSCASSHVLSTRRPVRVSKRPPIAFKSEKGTRRGAVRVMKSCKCI